MAILDELLQEIQANDIDERIKMLCDKIFEEESPKFSNLAKMPRGPNIFLALECPGIIKGDIAFVSLERESQGKFIIGVWAGRKSDDYLKRVKTFENNQTEVKKIFREYAEKYKYMNGE
jgi:hypothetical protein